MISGIKERENCEINVVRRGRADRELRDSSDNAGLARVISSRFRQLDTISLIFPSVTTAEKAVIVRTLSLYNNRIALSIASVMSSSSGVSESARRISVSRESDCGENAFQKGSGRTVSVKS